MISFRRIVRRDDTDVTRVQSGGRDECSRGWSDPRRTTAGKRPMKRSRRWDHTERDLLLSLFRLILEIRKVLDQRRGREWTTLVPHRSAPAAIAAIERRDRFCRRKEWPRD